MDSVICKKLCRCTNTFCDQGPNSHKTWWCIIKFNGLNGMKHRHFTLQWCERKELDCAVYKDRSSSNTGLRNIQEMKQYLYLPLMISLRKEIHLPLHQGPPDSYRRKWRLSRCFHLHFGHSVLLAYVVTSF